MTLAIKVNHSIEVPAVEVPAVVFCQAEMISPEISRKFLLLIGFV